MPASRYLMLVAGTIALACCTAPAIATDSAPATPMSPSSATSKPLYVPPPGDTLGRRKWLNHLLTTPGDFTDHQVAEFKANIAVMSPEEVVNVKYTDAKVAEFKAEVAHMTNDEVRQLLNAWRRDSAETHAEARREEERRQQQVAEAIEIQKGQQRAEADRQKFRVDSMKHSDQVIAQQREQVRRESAQSQRDWLDSRYYDPYGSRWWNSYNRHPWHRPYYGPYR